MSGVGSSKRLDLLYIITKNFRRAREPVGENTYWACRISTYNCISPQIYNFIITYSESWQTSSIYEFNSSLNNLRYKQNICSINYWYYIGFFPHLLFTFSPFCSVTPFTSYSLSYSNSSEKVPVESADHDSADKWRWKVYELYFFKRAVKNDRDGTHIWRLPKWKSMWLIREWVNNVIQSWGCLIF